jgi:hypothetical protein
MQVKYTTMMRTLSERTFLRERGLRYDKDGRLKLDAVRSYYAGKCYLHVYALRVGYSTPQNERVCLSSLTVPRDMPSAEMRTTLLNLVAITAMEAGMDYVIRHMTPIKGETK